MQLHFTSRAPDQLPIDLLVLGCGADERPLKSACGLIDWRLYGFISQNILAQRFRAEPQECLLIPGTAQLRCRWILLVGLGTGDQVNDKLIQFFGEKAIYAAMQLRVASCAIFYPHILLSPNFRNTALRWILSGLSHAATLHANNPEFQSLRIYLSSIHEETIDLSQAMISKLVHRHSVEQMHR